MNKHKGSTLVIVLVILVLVTLIGAMAVRTGIFDLRIATNSQIQALLMENSNAALFNVEDPSQVERRLLPNGMFGYFLTSDNSKDELVFCYEAKKSAFFSLTQASVIAPDGSTTKNGVLGYCKADSFTSGRSAVLSQIYLSNNEKVQGNLEHFTLGTSVGQNKLPNIGQNVSATVISILPSFSSATSTQLEACFKKSKSEVAECFKGLSVPFNIQHADYVVSNSLALNSTGS